ncbi:MAG: rRNA pseudouridine synthase [Anaerolineae bacterium]|nr:rRNA pseudouridine synthase [Anaerolineae bacterium]
MGETQRLQKVMARAGVASRRKCEEMIAAGRVTVNGIVVTRLGTKVDPERDDVRVDGRSTRIRAGDNPEERVYVLLNKPTGVISAMRDPRGRRALGDLLTLDPSPNILISPLGPRYPILDAHLFPVGRLDYDSEGLILLTNDGELANLLTHPRYEHEKEYRVTVAGKLADEVVEAWRRGVVLDGKRTAPAKVEVLDRSEAATDLCVVMHEGRKRQIRRVADLFGHPVRRLVRVRIGSIKLGSLDAGQWRYLTDREVKGLEAIKEREEA